MKPAFLTSRRLLLVVGLALFSILYIQMRPMTTHERECAGKMNRGVVLDSLYEGANTEFLSAGKCDHCHGLDDNGIASTDAEGTDVNLVDDWSSTMMANSAKDPFWRAKVSHEVFVNPQHQVEIEGTCTKCHAPLGRFAGLMNGVEDYSIEDMLQDSVALDGVSCLACHRQAPQPETALHTGNLIFTENHVAYGQYQSPLISPMAAYTGYNPEQAAHISDSKLCAACHSLVTQTVDLDGNLTGDEFVEQATWHEWLNSSYPAQNTTCQTCHLPKLEGQEILLAAGYPTVPRPDFALHTLAGGNSLMLKILRDNREELGIFPNLEFNRTIQATVDNLQNKSLTMEVSEINRTADTLYIDVKLRNITGHKLPSGYPSRRMTVHFVLNDGQNNELFRSGGFDGNYYMTEEDSPLEPHHNNITSEEDVQIYEMVMGDVNNDRTTVLTRGYSHMKDNRLVPNGFTQSNEVYDTTEVVLGMTDTDFNFDPAEGSGSDIIHYKIPMNGFTGAASVNVKVFYQSLPPVWMEEIFTVSTEEIDTFSDMFDAADKSPVLMKQNTIQVDEYIAVKETASASLARIINTLDHHTRIITSKTTQMQVFDLNGKLLLDENLSAGQHELDERLSAGTYLLVISAKGGERQVEKVIVR